MSSFTSVGVHHVIIGWCVSLYHTIVDQCVCVGECVWREVRCESVRRAGKEIQEYLLSS